MPAHRAAPAERLGAVAGVALADRDGAVAGERVGEAVEVIAGEVAERREEAAAAGADPLREQRRERASGASEAGAVQHRIPFRMDSFAGSRTPSSARCAVNRTASARSRCAARSAATAVGPRRLPSTCAAARARLRVRCALQHRDERGLGLRGSGSPRAARRARGRASRASSASRASAATRATSAASNGFAGASAIRSSSASWRTRSLADSRLPSANVSSCAIRSARSRTPRSPA